MPKKRIWTFSPPRPQKSKIPERLKASVEALAESFLEQVLKPKLIEPPPENPNWNYVTGVFMKWHQSALYFVRDFASPSPNAISPTFKLPLARMTYAGKDEFDLAYRRHNDQWVTLYQGLSIEKCFEAIAEEPFFL